MKAPPELVLAEGFLSASNMAALSGSSELGKEEQEALLMFVCYTHKCAIVLHAHGEARAECPMSLPIALHAAALTPGLSLNQKFTVCL